MRATVVEGNGRRQEARMAVRRRNLMATAAAAAAAGLAAPRLVRAQGDAPWPDRPLRLVVPWPPGGSTDIVARAFQDRKSTRLNSSHANISYAVFCLKKKKIAK